MALVPVALAGVFALGPVATIQGVDGPVRLPTHGMSNPKGSIDGAGAIDFVRKSLIPMFNAHGGLRADRHAVVVCDGVGTHMTSEFLDFCEANYIEIVLRTPNCSNTEYVICMPALSVCLTSAHAFDLYRQFEDLVNFWHLKNNKIAGFFKLKQTALWEQLATHNTNGLSHARQLQVRLPFWHHGHFSRAAND